MQSSSNILGSIGLVLVVLLSVIAIAMWLRSRRSKSNYHPSIKRSLNRSTSGAKSARQQVAVQKYVKHVGPELRKRYGKQSRYTPAQVKQTVTASGYSSQDDCYAFALYCAEDDFVDYHRSIGESCDYNSMRSEISDSFGFIFPSGSTFDAAEVIDNSDRFSSISIETTTDNSGSSWFSQGDFGGGSSTDTGSSNYSSSDSGGGSDGGGSGGGGD
jgi:uncharacterized membrane protein YgcG